MEAPTLRDEIVQWNNRFPLDYWWRKKHNVAFGSDQHLSMSPMDILFEYEEEKEMERQRDELKQWQERRKQYEAGEKLQSKPLSEEETADLMSKLMGSMLDSGLE